jgi:hypothetical protein
MREAELQSNCIDDAADCTQVFPPKHRVAEILPKFTDLLAKRK